MIMAKHKSIVCCGLPLVLDKIKNQCKKCGCKYNPMGIKLSSGMKLSLLHDDEHDDGPEFEGGDKYDPI